MSLIYYVVTNFDDMFGVMKRTPDELRELFHRDPFADPYVDFFKYPYHQQTLEFTEILFKIINRLNQTERTVHKDDFQGRDITSLFPCLELRPFGFKLHQYSVSTIESDSRQYNECLKAINLQEPYSGIILPNSIKHIDLILDFESNGGEYIDYQRKLAKAFNGIARIKLMKKSAPDVVILY